MENGDICSAHRSRGVTAAGAGGDELGPGSRSHEHRGDEYLGQPPASHLIARKLCLIHVTMMMVKESVRMIALLIPYVHVTSHRQANYRCSHGIFLILRECFGLNCLPPNSYVEVLTPHPPSAWNITVFGDKIFEEVIMLK